MVSRAYQVSAEGLANGGITHATPVDVQAFLADQRQYYRDVFGKKALPRVKLPPQRPGFSWGLIMAPFMADQWLHDCARERFGAWKYWDESLDTAVVHNDRDPKKNGPYAFWCRDRVEADEEHKSKSFNQIIAAGIKGMTVAEYENLFIWFHWKTRGKFLDRSNWTLLTGSLCRGGSVPRGGSRDGGLYVNWYRRDFADDSLRSREVVLVG